MWMCVNSNRLCKLSSTLQTQAIRNSIALTLWVDNIPRACIHELIWSSQAHCECEVAHPLSVMWKGVLRKGKHLCKDKELVGTEPAVHLQVSWLQNLGSLQLPHCPWPILWVIIIHPPLLLAPAGLLGKWWLRFRQLCWSQLGCATATLLSRGRPSGCTKAFVTREDIPENGWWGHPEVATNRPRFHSPAGGPNGQASEGPTSIRGTYSWGILAQENHKMLVIWKVRKCPPVFHTAPSVCRWEDQDQKRGENLYSQEPVNPHFSCVNSFFLAPKPCLQSNHFRSFFRVFRKFSAKNASCKWSHNCMWMSSWDGCLISVHRLDSVRAGRAWGLILSYRWGDRNPACFVTCSGHIVSWCLNWDRSCVPGAHNWKALRGGHLPLVQALCPDGPALMGSRAGDTYGYP